MPRCHLTTLVLASLPALATAQARSDVRFNRDIRPILSDRCFRCHGPDAAARKAGLRLDTREGALAKRRGGTRAVAPGDPAASLLVARIGHADPAKRMPPRASGKTLDPAEIALLERWITAGAPWEEHWSHARLERPEPPAASKGWARNEVDRFLLARLGRIRLEPAPAADARTLIRRLHFDLIGLPPAPEVVDAFVADPSDAAYRAIVERLLASPGHAERLTMYWLDLVRYGDSCGIHGDQEISMSPYRDWVIRAFRENKPFDVFTREQLAGDLLPHATLSQRVASGYNRLNPKTAEGGAQPKEYLAKYAADRVRTTATTWLGSTVGCAECHDHKFDPFTTRDFYRFAAYFADLEQKGFYAGANRSGDWGPKVTVPSPEQAKERERLRARIAGLERRYARPSPRLDAAREAWERSVRAEMRRGHEVVLGPWRSVGPFAAGSLRRAHDTPFGPEKNADAGRTYRRALRWQDRADWKDGIVHRLQGDGSATYVWRSIESQVAQRVQLSLGSDDSIKVWLNGGLVLSKYVARGVAPGQEKPVLALRKGSNELLMKISNGGGAYGFYFAVARAGPPPPIREILAIEPGRRTGKQQRALDQHFRRIAPELAPVRRELAAARRTLADFEKRLPTTLVAKARATPRVTRVLPRGNWLDETGEIVAPGPPAFLAAPRPGKRQTRLDLANWLTARENPLTARVFMNRLWKLFFGKGLAATLDDVGSQGDWPRHLALLDWLAVEFIDRGWDVRAMIRTLVTSSAYRQSSRATRAQRARDPENREFARQNAFRHDAEVVRDNALAVSGLLVSKVGGPSVRPYQPPGYWSELNFPKRRYERDTGASQYRRGLYTHWQRTFLHPSLRAFDAPSREECTAERMRSNTPLQALVLLNDPTYVEAARTLGARILREGGDSFDQRLNWTFRRVLSRDPVAGEVTAMRTFWKKRRARYATDTDAARELTSVGLAPTAQALDPADHAAWTAVARVLLNLHETITRY